MEFFTSVNNGYLPKARILAKSIKKNNKDAIFTLVLSERETDIILKPEDPFDRIILIKDLDIPTNNLEGWIFQHNVVELCTAVKPFAFIKLMNTYGANKVTYLDPDIVVYSNLDILDKELDSYSFLLTPHQTIPETSQKDIINNEISGSLKHGIFNLGFLSVRNDKNGFDMLNWWANRLLYFCEDNLDLGVFTDQKWMDLSIAFFDNFKILKNDTMNVAPWNINNRHITVHGDDYFVNGKPLDFYHFTGFDSGAHKSSLQDSSTSSNTVFQMVKEYENKLKEEQLLYKDLTWTYSTYVSGEKIEGYHRKTYRNMVKTSHNKNATNPFEAYQFYESSYLIHNPETNKHLAAYNFYIRLQKTSIGKLCCLFLKIFIK